MTIYVGTSGYSYDDWVGPFYPANLPPSERLSFYAREFRATELNFTYYRMPNVWTMQRIAAKVPPGFLFTVKAPGELTHERAKDNQVAFQTFRNILRPLQEGNKFGCVLIQFPFSFHATAQNRAYLEFCREQLSDLPVVVEFRNAGWIEPETFEWLRRWQLGFCCVDQPKLEGLVPPIAEATGPVAYVRFHGRNYQKWWKHEEAWERYDYTYAREELEEWVPKIQQLDRATERVFVFANNHWQGQAVDTARQLKLLLGEAAC